MSGGTQSQRRTATGTAQAADLGPGRSGARASQVAQVLEVQIVVLNGIAEVENRRGIAVVDSSEASVRGSQVGKENIFLVPILERKLPSHAPIVSARDRRHFVSKTAPHELAGTPDLGRQRFGWFRQKRNGVFQLRIREPAAGAVVKYDMPLVPAAVFVFVENAADHLECFRAIHSLRADLDGRNFARQIADLADLFKIQIPPNQNGAAVLTRGLNRSGPAELNSCAAVWAVSRWLAHCREEDRAGRSAGR